nr:N-acetylglucosaminidase [Bacillus mesophilus]
MVARGTAFILLDNNVTGDSFNGSTTWFKIEYENQILYVHSSLASSSSRIAKTKAVTNIHADVNSTSHIYGTVSQGALLRVVSEGTSWNSIGIGAWRNATSDDTSYFLNPINFKDDDTQKYQFLDLRYFTDIPSAELAQLLNGKGILSGTEDIFRQVASQAKINELYLISHALLETGNGTSPLATGVVYNGKTVYNFFGIHAFDSCPIECGAKKAYDEGWFTVELAIAGGAEFAKNSYIYNGQNTLYSMRWNPAGMAEKGSATHQYATDIGWSNKQVHYYSQFYFGREYNLHFDIPVYK